MAHNLMILRPKGEAMIADYPAEKRFVKDVRYPPEGGILTWFDNEPYPEKQLVCPEMVALVNPIKRSIQAGISLVKRSLLLKIACVVLILPGLGGLRHLLLEYYANVFWSGLRLFALKPERLCTSAREIRRVAMTISENITLIDCFCFIWEYDNAYRYRGQDLAGILDKDAFLQRPAREGMRVVGEFIKRETEITNVNKAQMFKYAVGLAMCLPHVRRAAKKFVREADWEKIKLDNGDMYWSLHRTDYNIYGLDLIDRMRRRSLMKLK